MTPAYDTALVFGAGAFGTSVASVLSNNFKTVYLKVREERVYRAILKGENSDYLPGRKLPKNLVPILSWSELDKNFKKNKGRLELMVNGLPTNAINAFYSENKVRIEELFKKQIPLVSLTKGIVPETCELPDDLFMHHFSEYAELICYLSGPSFAEEILGKQVTIVSLAGKNPDTLMKCSQMMQTDFFKAIPTYDIKGVLLGGALKNILAIAGGILEGLGFNHNTRAAMITRGITEMLRFGKVYNARPETFYGFAGMGDLILTTTSDLSRNKTFGKQIAQGRSPQEILATEKKTVEGYRTSLAAHKLAQKYHIKTRLFDGIYRILYEGCSPQDVIKEMMELPISSIE